jgi:predicted dehydrogenase
VGYILRHHPSWQRFINLSHTLGKPLVMRMNLNQQSQAEEWRTHRTIMETTSPLVDCGVHYVDVMSQMTQAKASHVHAIGARLTDEVGPDMYNYGQLQVTFEDGSVGWYEAGWGPMMSENAFFVKDVIGPLGALSIESDLKEAEADSSDVHNHTTTNRIRHHHASRDENDRLSLADDFIETDSEPDHDELCKLEQKWFLDAIRGSVDVSQHLDDVMQSLRIVLAADESIRTRSVIALSR